MSIATLKRINPDEALQAYIELNIKPTQGEFYISVENCACGLGAIAIKLGQNFGNDDRDYFKYFKSLGYDHAYLSGFTSGFDELKLLSDDIDSYKLGHEDGLATWQKVKHLVP